MLWRSPKWILAETEGGVFEDLVPHYLRTPRAGFDSDPSLATDRPIEIESDPDRPFFDSSVCGAPVGVLSMSGPKKKHSQTHLLRAVSGVEQMRCPGSFYTQLFGGALREHWSAGSDLSLT